MSLGVQRKNSNGFELDWKGEHKDIHKHIVYMVLRYDKMPQEVVGSRIRLCYKDRLKDAGWWTLGYEYNNAFRLLRVGPKGGTGKGRSKETADQVRALAEEIKTTGWKPPAETEKRDE